MSRNKRPFFKHYKKIFVNEFRGYNAKGLLQDVMAGLTVAAVALPLALAFGAASVSPDYVTIGICAGMITAIVAGLVTGLLGGGSFQISGPTGAMTVVLGTIVAGPYGIQGMFLATFLAGLILLVAGLLRFGKLISFIPRPVVTGFTSGIAVVIALGQLGNFFGVSLEGESTLAKFAYFFTDALPSIDWLTVCLSVAVVVIMIIYPKKLQQYVPGSLVAIILVTAITAIFNLDVAKIGAIPASLINSEVLNFKAVDFDMIKGVLSSTLTIAALGTVESLLCGTSAANMKKEKFDSNVELIAQGIGNMVAPMLGGVPSTAAIARTSVAIKSGGRTRLTSVFQSLFLIVCMFILSGVIGMVPYATLAGVLVVTAWRMNEWESIIYYVKHRLWEALLSFFITMVATVVLGLTAAILIGVVLALFFMVSKLSQVNIEISEEEDFEGPKTAFVYCTGALFFANAKEIEKMIEREGKDFETYAIVMRGIVYLDVSAVTQLMELVENLRAKGEDIYFTGVRPEIRRTLIKCGFVDLVGRNHFFSSTDKLILSGVLTDKKEA